MESFGQNPLTFGTKLGHLFETCRHFEVNIVRCAQCGKYSKLRCHCIVPPATWPSYCSYAMGPGTSRTWVSLFPPHALADLIRTPRTALPPLRE